MIFVRCIETDTTYCLSGDEDSFKCEVINPLLARTLITHVFKMHERYIMPMIARAKFIGFIPEFHGLIRAQTVKEEESTRLLINAPRMNGKSYLNEYMRKYYESRKKNGIELISPP